MRRDLPTAPLAAAGLIAGYGVAVLSDSRALGGAVLAAFGAGAVAISASRDNRATTAGLTAVALVAFTASHPLGHAIGAWPAVLAAALVTGVACRELSDKRRGRAARSHVGEGLGEGSRG